MLLFSKLFWGDARPRFLSPLAGGRTAVILSPLFRQTAGVHFVDPAEGSARSAIERRRPAVLAGTRAQLAAFRPFLSSGLPTHALVVFTSEGDRCLTEIERDELWNAYGVPMFEQVITESGELVAWECEAHFGLHLGEGIRAIGGFAIDKSECACGSQVPRILSVEVAPRITAAADRPPLIPVQLGSSQRPLPT